MKSSWSTIIVVAAVLGLLTAFLGLQYNWQLQASAAERDRMQKRVEADARNFADDFNREIQGAFFNFQVDPNLISGRNTAEISKRYSFWKQNTEFPDLIRDIIFFPNGGGGDVLRFDAGNESLVPASLEAPIGVISDQIKSGRNPEPVMESEFALVLPLQPSDRRVERIMVRRTPASAPAEPDPKSVILPKPSGYLVIFLDKDVVMSQVVPTLSRRHFSTGEYELTITDRSGNPVLKDARPTAEPDAAANLFDLRPDNLVFFSNRELLPDSISEKAATLMIDQRIENRSLDPEPQGATGGETFTIQMNEGANRRRTAVISGTSSGNPLWRLGVRHVSGSIDSYIQTERNKSFLIGLGVYLLLTGSILAIVFSSIRVRRYAQRQIDFVSSVSHEFRTPISVIFSAGENLADGVAKEKSQVLRYGDLIKSEGKKLSSMVEQILEFAGARSGKRRYNLEDTEISGIVQSALDECQPQLSEAGFVVEAKFPQTEVWARVDSEAIESAVRNLIQNAIKYSNGSRWMRVSVENGGDSITISVDDRGIGFSTQDQKRIFEPFYRAKDVVDAQIHGNGLGLSLVKGIAEAHNGRVYATSQPGKGSRFTIEIPQVG